MRICNSFKLIGWEIQNNFFGQVQDFLPVFTHVWGMSYEVNDVTPAHAHEPGN